MLLTHCIDGVKMYEGTPQQNLDEVVREIIARSKRLKLPNHFQDIRLSMFVPTREKIPMLKGQAAEIKALGKPLLEIWEMKMSMTNQHHRLVRLALQACVQLDVTLDANKGHYRLIGEAEATFRRSCWSYIACVSALGNYFHRTRGEWLFHFTMKYHYIAHLGQTCSETSPRVGWCYAGEDLMQKVKMLVQSCSRGTPTQLLPNKVLERYVIALSYVALGKDGWWR